MNLTIREVTVMCRKAGEGNLQYQRPGQIVDGMFRAGETFSIRPFETKKLPEDVVEALRKHFPSMILTDDEARAEQLKSDAALRAKDEQINSLQGKLDAIQALASRAAKGDKKAIAELAKALSDAKVAEDAKPIVKVMPYPATAPAEAPAPAEPSASEEDQKETAPADQTQ